VLFYRTLVHALIVLLASNLLAALCNGARLEGLGLVSAAHFLIFSLAMAAGLNEQRSAIVLLVVIALLLAWPPSPASVVAILIPTTAGMLAGGAARQLVREATRIRRTHGRRREPVREQFPSRGEHAPANDRARPVE
jgi:predicted branched-subunit amino acid permease